MQARAVGGAQFIPGPDDAAAASRAAVTRKCPAAFGDGSRVIPANLLTGRDVPQGIEDRRALKKAGVRVARMIDHIVEQRAVGAEPEIGADLKGQEIVGELPCRQESAAEGKDETAAAYW